MTDPRPEPKYGQYAPIPEFEPAPPAVPVQFDAAPLARRNWDVLLTSMLLLIGVFDVVTGFSQYANLGVALEGLFEQQGIGEFTSFETAATVGLVINFARIALLVVAIGWSLKRLSGNRISFWVPLSAGLLSGVIVLVGLIVVIAMDPAFAEYVASQTP